MKKILCIVQLPPPVHGVTLMNKYLVESTIIKSEFNLSVLPLNFNTSMQTLYKFSIAKVLRFLNTLVQLFWQLLTGKVDLVYFTLNPTGRAFYRDLLYVSIIKLFRVPRVWHIYGKGIQEQLQNKRSIRFLYNYAFAGAEVICLSEILVDDMKGINHKTPFILPCGIPSSNDVAMRSAEDKLYDILFFSNFNTQKGVIELIDILQLLKQQRPQFSVVIGGSSSDYSKAFLDKRLLEYGLENNVTIIETFDAAQKFDLFNKSRIFVFPTQNEAFGLVILEAMQAGLPVIASMEGAIPDLVIQDKTGYLLDKRDMAGFAEKINLLLSDKIKIQTMGMQGNEHYKKFFRLEGFEENIKNIFAAITSKKASAANHKILKSESIAS